jgi:tyrosyl-tRNA synthetase
MNTAEHLEVLTRGAVFTSDLTELSQKLEAKKSLRIKVGFDPTQADLHLGHTVLMQKMRQLQDLGHQVIFLIGDFTARIGDPTGRNALRPTLSKEQVNAAAQTYQEQAFKVLDRNRTEVRFNSEWLDALSAQDMVELCSKYTVSRMLERDDFRKRFHAQKPISMHEFLYPLLQGLDSVKLEADLELGGSDQLFNLNVGRDLMVKHGKAPQSIMTFPLLVGTEGYVDKFGVVEGEKMSKSLGNHIAICAPPHEMMQQIMLLDDGLIWQYITLLSDWSPLEVSTCRRHVLEDKDIPIVAVKEQFAMDIVTRFHGEKAAEQALLDRQAVAKGNFPSWTPKVTLPAQPVLIGKALFLTGLVKSASEGTRMVRAGAISVNDQHMRDDKFLLQPGQRFLVAFGHKNRKFVDIQVGE